jgi:shikimate 5-dehydrogenase
MNQYGCTMTIGPTTKFIISTSGRVSSIMRYKILLQDILNADIAYIPISTNCVINTKINPQNFANILRSMNCIGGAISKDIKHTIIPFLDNIDELAAMVQAVNTVLVRDDKLIGYNTDALGFRIAIVNALEQHSIIVTKAVCYGYGGVTSVVVSVLKSLGIEVYICGRRLDEAGRRASELSAKVWSEDCSDIQLFVNAAPVSSTPLNEAVNFLTAVQGCRIVFDHEMPGEYLKQYCEDNNIKHISGYEMYYPQMYEQWKMFLNGLINPNDIEHLIQEAENRMKP